MTALWTQAAPGPYWTPLPKLTELALGQYLRPVGALGSPPEGSPGAFHVVLEGTRGHRVCVSSHRKRPSPRPARGPRPSRASRVCRLPAGRGHGDTAGRTPGALSTPFSALGPTCPSCWAAQPQLTRGGSATSRERPRQRRCQLGCCPAGLVSVGARGRLGPQSGLSGARSGCYSQTRRQVLGLEVRGARGALVVLLVRGPLPGRGSQERRRGRGLPCFPVRGADKVTSWPLGCGKSPGAPASSQVRFTPERPGASGPGAMRAPQHLFPLPSGTSPA